MSVDSSQLIRSIAGLTGIALSVEYMKIQSCKYCGSTDHYSIMCFHRPRLHIKPTSDKYYRQAVETKIEWFKANPANKNGQWKCYLHISKSCPRMLDRNSLTLEHVESKVRHPELRFDITNIRPSCTYCNKVKGSQSLEQLAETYPHLKLWS